jgi:hypothetical protein
MAGNRIKATTAPAKLRPLDGIIDHLFNPSEGDRPGLRPVPDDRDGRVMRFTRMVEVPIAGPREFSVIAAGKPIKIRCGESRKQKEG